MSNKEFLEPISALGITEMITSHEMSKKRIESVEKSYEVMELEVERYKKIAKRNRIKDFFKALLNVLTVIDAMIFVMAGCALDSESNLPFYVALVTGLALVIRLYFAGAFVFRKEI